MSYHEKFAESFMGMAGDIQAEYDKLEANFQTALNLLQDLCERPYTGDYDYDSERASYISNFILEHKTKEIKIQVPPPNIGDDLPF